MDYGTYLEGQLNVDQSVTAAIEDLIGRALRTLRETQLPGGKWPYALTNGESPAAPEKLSEATSAMILHAVAVVYGSVSRSILVPAVRVGRQRKASTVEGLLRVGTEALVDSLEANSSHGSALTTSRTFGDDNPLTLTWLYELLSSGLIDQAKAAPIIDRVRSITETRIQAVIDDPQSVRLTSSMGNDYSVEHPFPSLRLVHLARAINSHQWTDLSVSKLPTAFLSELHRELSNSAIRDGGFDPASLVFALEGLLLLNPDAVSDAILDQVVNVLGSAPSVASHWRPVRPLSATSQGLILLPQSVEVANSYLRICALTANRYREGEPLFTRSINILQSYADWLVSCMLRVRIGELASEPLEGWQSEHTYRPNIIHLWATSQVVLFLQHYSAMLQQHIARCSRIAAGLQYRRAEPTSELARSALWEDARAGEPLAGLPEGSPSRAYESIERFFVAPRIGDSESTAPRSYSMLLYGPPGTGKTTFARQLAHTLAYDMITVTPSDFIRSGEANVEHRAKEVFDVLVSQSDTVILFDEIDRLLLDRDSKLYANQGSMFQFMTPSMLTKINDLRRKERCVFIIATNYAERIDGAIKRPGRIDEQILLLPPDMQRRKEIIVKIAPEVGISADELDVNRIARETPLAGIAELEQLLKTIANSHDNERSLEEATDLGLEKRGSSAINLSSYRPRFRDDSGKLLADVSRGPWREFALLTYLQAETGFYTPGAKWERQVLDKPELLDELDSVVSDVLRSLW